MDEDNFISDFFPRKDLNLLFTDSKSFGEKFYQSPIGLTLYWWSRYPDLYGLPVKARNLSLLRPRLKMEPEKRPFGMNLDRQGVPPGVRGMIEARI